MHAPWACTRACTCTCGARQVVLGWPSALEKGRELGLGLGRLRSQLELSEARSHLPTSPYISLYLPISPHISPYLPMSPHISLYLVYLELREAESRRVLVKNPMLLGQSYEAQLLPMCAATQARRVHAVCMACAWRVHGVCMARACRVHGACMPPCACRVQHICRWRISNQTRACPFLCAPW